jgi:uncharacterized protein YrzB (UPF0473 family)
MSDEYGGDLVTITDDDGNESVLEHLDTIEIGDDLYMAFVPADMDEDDEDYGMILLKVIEENGEQLFASIDDEDELQNVYERFMEQIFSEDEEPEE